MLVLNLRNSNQRERGRGDVEEDRRKINDARRRLDKVLNTVQNADDILYNDT